MGSLEKRHKHSNTRLARGVSNNKVARATPKDDITVELMQPKESRRVKSLILQEMYQATSSSIAVDVVQRWPIMTMTVISACLLYLVTLSMYIANVPFLVLPLLGYYYVTKVQTPKLCTSNPDMSPGVDFSDYWCNNLVSGRYLWVAKLGDKIVGVAAVSNMSDTSATINKIAVLQNYQLRGIGTRLLYTLLESCIRRNILHIELTTTYKQTGAHRLFEKFGFKKVAEMSQGTFWPFFTFPSYQFILTSDVLCNESLED